MKTLNHLLDELENSITFHDAIDVKVSQREVSWHIAHSLKVIGNIIKVLQSSDPKEYRWQFNWIRSFVYTFNSIPRGKGKAPKSVLPDEHISIAMLHDEVTAVRKSILALENLEAKSHFKHPYFGILNLQQTKKFLALHTQHHLKIIADIIAATRV